MRPLAPGLSLMLLSGFISATEIDWPKIRLIEVCAGLQQPTDIASAPDGSGRLFITEQRGQIRILSGTNLAAIPFLDITNRVALGGEAGLLGLAFSPNYQSNGYFYVSYSRKPDTALIFSRFSRSSDPSVADPVSEQTLLTIPPEAYYRHFGGDISFGPDGFLYLSIGDGGVWETNQSQSLDSLRGKLLRIQVENAGTNLYLIPAQNPFVSTVGARPEIWAYGLRNPWRFSFDRLTGDLYLPDVGNVSVEELNFRPPSSTGGENYGWQCYEGFSPARPTNCLSTNGLIFPVLMYNGNEGRSIIGGFAYRGVKHSRMIGFYFCGDWLSEKVWAVKSGGVSWPKIQLIDRGVMPSSFGEDAEGELHVADWRNGRILRLEDDREAWPAVLTPSAGNVESVTVSSLTPNCRIHFTRNGTIPTQSDPWITNGGRISIDFSQVVRTRVFRSDVKESTVTSGTYDRIVSTPVFFPTPRPITNGQIVQILMETSNSTVYYTVNGSDPTTNSSLYSTPLRLNGNTTLKAKAFRSGFTSSAVQSGFYDFLAAEPPQFDPPSGMVTNGTRISLRTATEGATIRYGFGSTPSIVYTAPFPLTNNGSLQLSAYAFKSGYKTSLYTLATYDVRPPSPEGFEVKALLLDARMLRLEWPSTTGYNYEILGSHNLIKWQTNGPPVPGTGSVIQWTNQNSSASVQFYRVRAFP